MDSLVKRIELFCATGNPGKRREFQQAAGPDVVIRGLPPVPCPEDGKTFEENAKEKALCYSRAAASLAGESRQEIPLVFADDSGLVVDALGGAPGVHSARFAGPNGGDEANNTLLLEKLRGLPPSERTARFVCCIALTRGGNLHEMFRAEVVGVILDRPVGTGGFGYDPLFFDPVLGKSFAQLTPSEKWRASHRGRAFRKMLAWLRDLA